MSTALNLEPPPAAEITLESALQPGCDVWVELLSGFFYPGKVGRIPGAPGEVSIETPAAQYMSQQWKTLLFYPHTRKSVYGLATLHIPGIDPDPDPAKIKREYDKQTQGVGTLDEPEALSREEDIEGWEQGSTLTEDEQKELWYNREN